MDDFPINLSGRECANLLQGLHHFRAALAGVKDDPLAQATLAEIDALEHKLDPTGVLRFGMLGPLEVKE